MSQRAHFDGAHELKPVLPLMMRWTAPATGIAMCQITELVVVLTRCSDLGFLKRQFKLVDDLILACPAK